MKMLRLNNKKYILWLFLVFILLFVIFIHVFKYTYTPEFIEKETFSAKETEMIYEILDINSHQTHIDKLTFSHAKDILFVIYISNVERSDLLLNYSKCDSYSSEIYYRKNNNPNINVVLNENNGKYTAIFRIECYNEILYDIAKSK